MFSILKKFNCLVLPGVLLNRASFFLFVKELISELFKEMKKSNTIGITRNPELLSDDPEKWNTTKLYLFTGGRYLEGADQAWGLMQ